MNSETIPLTVMVTTYIAFLILIITGHIRDTILKHVYRASCSHLLNIDGRQPLYTFFESFFIRRLYTRICDCWNRPITGVPGKTLKVLVRRSDDENQNFKMSGDIISALNVGSYNYLGLACSLDFSDVDIDASVKRLSVEASIDDEFSGSKNVAVNGLKNGANSEGVKNLHTNSSNEKIFNKTKGTKSQMNKPGNVSLNAETSNNCDENSKKDRMFESEKNVENKTEKASFEKQNELGNVQIQSRSLKTRKTISARDILRKAVFECPVNIPGTFRDVGKHSIISLLEEEVADFIGTESACVFPMGFATNSCLLPLLDENTLVLSDELNHASIVYGLRMSSSTVRTFKHNNLKSLEAHLRDGIAFGQPRTHKKWDNILVIIEGIYSMEGTIADLPGILELKKTYKFALFIDEAHSIGALGRSGRGICEYYNVNPDTIDILMGTFTKTFGAAGGYIAGSHKLVSNVRANSDLNTCGEMMPCIVAAQVIHCIHALKNDPSLCARLAQNTRYFRKELSKRGFVIFGDNDSPVVPLMIFNPAKIADFSRMCLERRLAVVVVGYPATPVISSRVRFCMSASLSLKDVDRVIRVVEYVGKYLGLDIVSKKA